MSCSWVSCFFLINTHTYTTTLTGTEDFCTLISGHRLRHVNKDIATVLHQVLLFLTEVALSRTIDLLDGIQRVVDFDRTEVDKGITQERLVITRLSITIFIEEFSEVCILIVIDTVCTTKNLFHVSLYIFYIS